MYWFCTVIVGSTYILHSYSYYTLILHAYYTLILHAYYTLILHVYYIVLLHAYYIIILHTHTTGEAVVQLDAEVSAILIPSVWFWRWRLLPFLRH